MSARRSPGRQAPQRRRDGPIGVKVEAAGPSVRVVADALRQVAADLEAGIDCGSAGPTDVWGVGYDFVSFDVERG